MNYRETVPFSKSVRNTHIAVNNEWPNNHRMCKLANTLNFNKDTVEWRSRLKLNRNVIAYCHCHMRRAATGNYLAIIILALV